MFCSKIHYPVDWNWVFLFFSSWIFFPHTKFIPLFDDHFFFFLILRCSLIRLFALISIICLQFHSLFFCFVFIIVFFFGSRLLLCILTQMNNVYTNIVSIISQFLKFFQSIQIKHNIIVNCSVFPEWIHNKPMMMMMIFDITDNSMTDQPSDLRLYWRKKMRSKKNVKIKIDLTDWSKRFFSFFLTFVCCCCCCCCMLNKKWPGNQWRTNLLLLHQDYNHHHYYHYGKPEKWVVIIDLSSNFFYPSSTTTKKKTGRESTKWFNYLLEQQQQKRRDFFFIRLNILYLSALVIYNIEKRNVDWSWKFFFFYFPSSDSFDFLLICL